MSPCYRFTSRPIGQDRVHHELLVHIFGGWWAVHRQTTLKQDPSDVERELWGIACRRIQVGPGAPL